MMWIERITDDGTGMVNVLLASSLENKYDDDDDEDDFRASG